MKNLTILIFLAFTLLLLISQCKEKSDDTLNLLKKIDTIFQLYIDENYINDSVLDLYSTTKINCDSINGILNKVYLDDQEVRTTGNNDMYIVDSINKVKVISILEKCEIPVFKGINSWKSYHAIYLTLIHSSDSHLMAYYYKDIKEFVKKDWLNESSLALYIDKFLLNINKKQIFGTQIDKYGKLYKLENPLGVNNRRKSMNLGTIEEYLERYGLDFNEEIKN